MSGESDDVSEAIAGELRLMDPSVRRSPSLARQLLDPHFVEVGVSGRRWTLEELLAELPVMDGAAKDGPRYEPLAMVGALLAPGLVHLTYETTIGGDRARRSSLWRKQSAGAKWQLYYHQATPVGPEDM
ncbi:nuclear transport factor 2 family protein [Streptomyces sp. NPDC054888]